MSVAQNIRPERRDETDASTPVHKPSSATLSSDEGSTGTLVFTFVCLALLFTGIYNRDEYYLTAEHGPGYALGIAGGVMMLLLLIYPLRKRFRFMNHVLALRTWFRLHMLLGVVGPMCILFHCNFSLGSANSNVALIAMCLMVASGMVGRFLYSRIHFGLYGEEVSLRELQQQKIFAENLVQEDQEGAECRCLEISLHAESIPGGRLRFNLFRLPLLHRRPFVGRTLRQGRSHRAT